MGTYVGVSGFSYTTWKGAFYPQDTKSEDFLRCYSAKLRSVEINSSFYAPPRSSVLKSWAGKTGDGFRFSFKAPRKITHISKLGDGSSQAAKDFSDSISVMDSKRGPILFQLPPYMKYDLERLERFLSETPDIRERVFEFRNASWFQGSTYELLGEGGAAHCISETDERKPELQVIGDLTYFRLRRNHYKPSEIDSWAKVIRENASSSRACYVYLRHDETGENALLAQGLAEKLGV